jgi:hypothetical protein
MTAAETTYMSASTPTVKSGAATPAKATARQRHCGGHLCLISCKGKSFDGCSMLEHRLSIARGLNPGEASDTRRRSVSVCRPKSGSVAISR